MLSYPVMYSVFEGESDSKHARKCAYLSRLKIVPTFKNLICRCLLYDCEIDAVENYMFLTDSQLV